MKVEALLMRSSVHFKQKGPTQKKEKERIQVSESLLFHAQQGR